jgi:DNA-binding FadR family transcriptional regulator
MNGILSHKVSAQSLVDALAERIEAAIMSGDLQPGSKLSEQGLAASLGVSRGPLREAIRRLEGRKLLQRTPNIGVHVASLSPGDLYEVVSTAAPTFGLGPEQPAARGDVAPLGRPAYLRGRLRIVGLASLRPLSL